MNDLLNRWAGLLVVFFFAFYFAITAQTMLKTGSNIEWRMKEMNYNINQLREKQVEFSESTTLSESMTMFKNIDNRFNNHRHIGMYGRIVNPFDNRI